MRKRWSLLTSAVCLTLVTSACSSKEASGVPSERTAISVEVAKVNKESLDAISSLSGTLLPYEETAVSFEVGGRIEKMDAEIGDKVEFGTSLTQIDSADYKLQLAQADNAVLQAEAALSASDSAIESADVGISAAEAGISAADAGVLSSDESIQSAQANIKAAESRINSAQASLDALKKGAREQEKNQAKLAVTRAQDAYNKVKADAERVKALYNEGLASKQEYENAQLQVSNAQKDVANAQESLSLIMEGPTEEQLKQSQASIREAEAGKEQAQAGVGQSQAAKKQAEAAKEQAVTTVEQAKASKEQAVAAKEQSQASYDQALIGKEQAELTLSKTKLKSPITGVVLDKLVSEGQRVNPGDAVYKLGRTDQLKVLLPVPDKEIDEWKVGDKVSVTLYDKVKSGEVNKIYPQTNKGTGTISVEVVISNENLDWVPGQVVKANRVTSDNNGILVPIEAVISNGGNPYVFKEVKGRAVKTEVTTGNLVNNKIHIVKGLKEGEEVVVRGGELLLDGDPLKTDGGKTE